MGTYEQSFARAKPYSGAQIRQGLADRGLIGTYAGPNTVVKDPRAIYDQALSHGVTARQIDEALGYAPGRSAAWTREQGLAPLPTLRAPIIAPAARPTYMNPANRDATREMASAPAAAPSAPAAAPSAPAAPAAAPSAPAAPAAPAAAPSAPAAAPAYPGMPEWVTDDYTADAYRRGWRMQNGTWNNPWAVAPGQQAAYDALQAATTKALDDARATGNQEVYDKVRAGTDKMWETQSASLLAPTAQGEKPLTEWERHGALRDALNFLERGAPQLSAQSGVVSRVAGGPFVGRDTEYQEYMNNLTTARQHFGLWKPSESPLPLPGGRAPPRAWSLADLDALGKQARGIYGSEEARALREFEGLQGDRKTHFGDYKNLLSHNRALTAAQNLSSQPGPRSPQGAVAGKAATPSFSNLPTGAGGDNTPGPKPLEYPQLSPQTTRKGLIR
jgi:hypothetical protein